MKTSKNIKKKQRRITATLVIACLLFPVATALCILFQLGWSILVSAYLFLFFVSMLIIEHIAPHPLPAEVIPYDCVATSCPQKVLSHRLAAANFRKIEDIPFADTQMTLLYRDNGNGRMECFCFVHVSESPERAQDAEFNAVLEAFRTREIYVTAIHLTSIMVAARLTPAFAARVSDGLVVKQRMKQLCVGLVEGAPWLYLAGNLGPEKWFIGRQRKQLLSLLGFDEKTRGELVELVERKA